MLIDVITIFPEFFQGPLDVGMMQRAREKGLLQVRLWQLRDFTRDRHRTVDDTPYGGGAGMVMKPEPLVEALEAVRAQGPPGRAILLTPQGRVMDQAWAQERAKEERLILLCGRYEGVDERVRAFVDEELSVGDYVLTGGEYAALIVIDAVTRLVPGVLGSSASPVEESFSDGLLEYPQYTPPAGLPGHGSAPGAHHGQPPGDRALAAPAGAVPHVATASRPAGPSLPDAGGEGFGGTLARGPGAQPGEGERFGRVRWR